MLQNYDDCNKIVTNGKSGAKNSIIKSGDQIIHAFTAEEAHTHRCRHAGATACNGYIHARDKLESWKLE